MTTSTPNADRAGNLRRPAGAEDSAGTRDSAGTEDSHAPGPADGRLPSVTTRHPAPVRAQAPVPATTLRLSDQEAIYVAAARAPNTRRGYTSDWREFSSWCADTGRTALPAGEDAISRYLSDLAATGAKVGTMSRRLSSIRFMHLLRDHADPTKTARVLAVWEGIRRTHGAPAEQAAPLMPPILDDVLAACPTTRTWLTRPPEPDLAGVRDRALLLVGFWAALRRSELAALTVDRITPDPRGLVLSLPRSKTNQYGEQAELVVLPFAARPDRCPVGALTTWLQTAAITDGPVLRKVSKGNRVQLHALHPESVNTLLQQAVARAGITGGPYTAHSLRAGFVTYAHLRGATDRAIAHQTRHRSLATIGTYVRIDNAWTDNAATQLGL